MPSQLSEHERQLKLQKMQRLATTLDSSIALPGGYRIGLDGIIGMVPVVGDGVTALLSSLIILRAAQLGIATRHLMRMLFNVLLETVVGVVPLVGDLFDFAWKANQKNMALVERHLPASSPSRNARHRLSLAFIGVGVAFLLLLGLFVVLAVRLLIALFAGLSA